MIIKLMQPGWEADYARLSPVTLLLHRYELQIAEEMERMELNGLE
jgi:hypothetical protein